MKNTSERNTTLISMITRNARDYLTDRDLAFQRNQATHTCIISSTRTTGPPRCRSCCCGVRKSRVNPKSAISPCQRVYCLNDMEFITWLESQT